MKQQTDRPLTIVHTEASVGWGGQEIRIWQEARWLRGRGHRVLLFAPEGSELFRRGREDGFETEAFAFEKRSQWMDFLKLARVFRKLKPDVVGTHSSVDSWAGLLAARMTRAPVALRYRHVSAPVRGHMMNRFLYGQCCDHVLTTAECIRRALIANLGLQEKKVTTVATGIEVPAFKGSREQARRELCGRLGLGESARFVGCVAVLRSWKGQDDLLRAFEKVHERMPGHHLVLVGDGPFRGPLEELSRSLKCAGRVHFVGHQDSPWVYFRGFDAAVLPSYKDEGIPQSLLQAMFARCAVVGTSVGGIPEIVLDGETGWVVPPREVEQLGEILGRVAREREEAERRAGRAFEFVRERHTLDRMGEAVLGIIGERLHRGENDQA